MSVRGRGREMDGWIDGDGWDGMGREIKRKGMRERRRERERA